MNSKSAPNKWRTLIMLALAELLGMSVWFSARTACLGITGVPVLVMDNRYLVVDARPPETMEGIYEAARTFAH